MRWHCRLSHVAAHTKMLTIFLDDLISRPIVEIEKMLSFIGNKISRPDIIGDIPLLLSEMSKEFNSNFNQESDGTYSMLTSVEIRMIADTIELELNNTLGLSKWPCPSFRSLEKELINEKLIMSPSDLSANCSDPFVTCSVQYDQNGG